MKSKLFHFALLMGFVFSITNSAFAWDGKRKGFLLGIGAGAGLESFKYTRFSFYYGLQPGDRFYKPAFMTDFKIGYAPTNQIALYWMSKVAWFTNNILTLNGMGGIAISYYLRPNKSTFYVSAGYGYSTWGTSETGTQYGTGISIGGGYEFSRHWSVETNLSFGTPKFSDNSSMNTMALRVTLNVLGY